MHIKKLSRRAVVRHVVHIAVFIASIGLVALLPVLLGMSWSEIFDVLAGLSVATVAALTALWVLGLLTHTIVLTAALPGLTARRALLLNVSGSAVSNLVPFGGAAGMGLGYVMARTWKVSPTSYASFTAISNLWNVLGKLVVGTVLVTGSVGFGVSLSPVLQRPLLIGSSIVLTALIAGVAITSSARAAGVVSRGLDRLVNGRLASVGSMRRVDIERWVHEMREETSTTVAAGWGRLTFGVIGYLFLQALLLAACLIAVGAHLAWPVIAVAFGIERLLTLIPFTPGGSGFAELGTVGVLLAFGGNPIPVAAGVLLYRLFSFLMEIPVGGVSALVWLRRHNVSVKQAMA